MEQIQGMFDTKQMDEMISRNEIIVCDWDGVIQNIDIVWALLISQNNERFSDYFDAEKLFRQSADIPYIKQIVDRDEYYLNKWMLKEGKELPQDVFNDFLDLYVNNDKFYEYCPYTPLAEGLAILVNQKFCSKVIFLSHSVSSFENGYDKRKDVAFEEYKTKYLVSSDKMELHMIPETMSKHEWIKQNCPEYTCFIDDRFDIIEGVIDNTDSDLKTYLMPVYGYNKKCIEGNKEFFQKVNSKKSRFALINNVY